MSEHFLVAVFGALLLLQGILHARERKDLYTRIMAKDLTDYRQSTPKKGVSTIRRGGE